MTRERIEPTMDPRSQPDADAGVGQGTSRRTTGRRSLVDSPWFWCYLFACGAACALLLAIPKYRERQGDLEREYRARVAAGQTTEVPGAIAATERPGSTFIPIWPLLVLFLCIAGIVGGYLARNAFRGRTTSGSVRTDSSERHCESG